MGTPINGTDAACQQHDACYAQAGFSPGSNYQNSNAQLQACNQQLCNAVRASSQSLTLAENPRPGGRTSTHTLHRGFGFAISSTVKDLRSPCPKTASGNLVVLNNPLLGRDPSGLDWCDNEGCIGTDPCLPTCYDQYGNSYTSTATGIGTVDQSADAYDGDPHYVPTQNGSGGYQFIGAVNTTGYIYSGATNGSGPINKACGALNSRTVIGIEGAINVAIGTPKAVEGFLGSLASLAASGPTGGISLAGLAGSVYVGVAGIGQTLTGGGQLVYAVTGDHQQSDEIIQTGSILSGPVTGLGALLISGDKAQAAQFGSVESTINGGPGAVNLIDRAVSAIGAASGLCPP